MTCSFWDIQDIEWNRYVAKSEYVYLLIIHNPFKEICQTSNKGPD